MTRQEVAHYEPRRAEERLRVKVRDHESEERLEPPSDSLWWPALVCSQATPPR